MKNNADLKIMLREAGILFAITLIAGIVLGVINELTKDPIRVQQEKAVQEACQTVFTQAESFEEFEMALEQELSGMGVKIGSVYRALGSGSELLGYVVESVSTQGYGGNIVLYLGVTLDGTLNDISILEISETPGLGMLAPQVLVPQFHDRKVESFVFTKSGASAENEIDAITSATITTRAVTNGVNGGLKAAHILIEGGAGNE